jgi:RNA polymerase sigma-70 factor (ECF subfamily)
MTLSDEDLEKLRARLRFKVRYEVGFACPDVDDIVQESVARFLAADQQDRLRNPDAAGAFLLGVCRNVVSEYRRRGLRDGPMPEIAPEPQPESLTESDLLEIRQAVIKGLEQLPDRDRRILRAFYLEEKTKEQILKETGLTDQNFRVILCRAKEKFRRIYVDLTQHRAASRHSVI